MHNSKLKISNGVGTITYKGLKYAELRDGINSYNCKTFDWGKGAMTLLPAYL